MTTNIGPLRLTLVRTEGIPDAPRNGLIYGRQDGSWVVVTSGGGTGDGREVELQANATHIQWRYVGDPSWIDLVALSDLEGPQGQIGLTGPKGDTGDVGPQGPAGADGTNVTITATTDQTVYDNATPIATELVVLYDA